MSRENNSQKWQELMGIVNSTWEERQKKERKKKKNRSNLQTIQTKINTHAILLFYDQFIFWSVIFGVENIFKEVQLVIKCWVTNSKCHVYVLSTDLWHSIPLSRVKKQLGGGKFCYILLT